MRLLCAVALAITILGGPGAMPARGGATFYVSTNGSDANDGSWNSPWRTPQKASSTAPAGAIVAIRAGTYGAFSITRPSLTFTAFEGEAVYVNADSTHANAIRISATHDVSIEGLVAQHGPTRYGAGIRVDTGSYRITISGCLLRSNRSFGVMIDSSTGVIVTGNTIANNETGIQVSYKGDGVVISGNEIVDNDRMIVNDATANNDRGANGIVFYKTTGAITASNNRIHGNRASSNDYGHDGGAFEIYGASNVTMTGNTVWNNQNVLETGTEGSWPCRNLRFTRNVAYGGTDGGLSSQGMILRCSADSLVANNTFSDLTDFVYYVSQSGGFAGSISGLVITNNIARQTSSKAYSLQGALSGVTIDRNLAYSATGSAIAWVSTKGNTDSLAELRQWTGFEANGIQADPAFAPGGFKLTPGSAAIDAGQVLGDVTGGFAGTAPDLGRYELGGTSPTPSPSPTPTPGPTPAPRPTPALSPATSGYHGDTSRRVVYSKGWIVARSRLYLGGTVHFSRTPGATAVFRFSGSSITWLGPKGPTRGRANVYLDGRLVRRVDLWSLRYHGRPLAVFTMSWARTGTHTLTIRVVRTPLRPIVAIDAFRVR